jgi:5-methyltetrahydrofolate corrinoid/iron sulfur protein methyltransferase
MKAIEAGVEVHNNSKGRPIINSADAGDRLEIINLAADTGAICIALCSKSGVPSDNDERMMFTQEMLERAMELGMDPEDMWFDPLFLVVKGMQEKQTEALEFIRMLSDMGLNSCGGLSNISNGMPRHVRAVMDSTMIAMAMCCGLTSAILNPGCQRVMETIRSCEIIKNTTLYADSYLEI